MKKVEVEKADETIVYRRFRKPSIDIYNKAMNRKMAKRFIQFGCQKQKWEKNTDVQTIR